MAKTKSMNRNQNPRKRFKGGATPSSNLNHDVLFLVMKQLGFVDFLSFSRVCKSWRSVAVANGNKLLASRPPMVMSFSHGANNKNVCYMSDFELQKFKTILPASDRVTCFGLTCGYLILFGIERHDFWLVNPITGHQLHFPACPLYFNAYPDKAILVFSLSISKWVFLISNRFSNQISFYIAGKRRWKHVPSTLPILDLHAFKGKIYTLHTDCCLYEMKLNPKPKLTLLKTNNIPNPNMKNPEFVRSVENLCVIDWVASNELLELDFVEMKWISLQKTKEEYAVFVSTFHYFGVAAIKPELWESWADPQTQSKINDYLRDGSLLNTYETESGMFFYSRMWYFPHDCLKVNLLDE